jgi:flagellar hook-length control protein FliK
MRAAGGSLSPPGGKHLPLATLPAGPVATGSDARLHALAFALPPVQTATATPSPGLSESLATLPAPVNPAGAIPAPELRALLAADVIATDTDALTVAAGDALAAGDTPFTTATVRGAPTTAAVALPATRAELPRFEQALGERLAWLVQEGRHDARIRLHPAELGSIDIRLNQDGDATRISLVSPHAAVRDALEQAVPRLRELLGHAGLDLSQVNVGSGDARSHSDFGRAPAPAGLGPDAGAFAAEPDLTIASVTLRLPQGLVDTFA